MGWTIYPFLSIIPLFEPVEGTANDRLSYRAGFYAQASRRSYPGFSSSPQNQTFRLWTFSREVGLCNLMDRLALSGLVLSFEGRTTRCVPRCNGKHPSPRRRSAVGVIGPRNADLPNLIMLGQLCFATHLPFSNSKTFDSA